MSDTTARQPVVSVIICTRDRPDDLARCLPTVLANDYPDFEVIVHDLQRLWVYFLERQRARVVSPG